MAKSTITWTNPSILKFAGNEDPVARMEKKVRQVVLDAVDKGWSGPPFDPIELAHILNISVQPNSELADACVFWADDNYQIEYNPHRPRSRVNFSIAHEIAHTFFPDCAEVVRNRSYSRLEDPNWQLEVLCNIGAAELTMPIESFSSEGDIDAITIEELMQLRQKFQVSAEAVLIRLVKLTSSRVACFLATRITEHDHPTEYQINYRIESSQWLKWATLRVRHRVRSSVLDECVAIGATSKGTERWETDGPDIHVEAVALPPLPGTQNLRIAGFMRPALEMSNISRIEYRQGDAANFTNQSDTAIVHVVNDKAQNWGPYGFPGVLRQRYPDAYSSYASWKKKNPKIAILGAVHMTSVQGDNLYVVSLVAQKGYGKSPRTRIRYEALDEALCKAGNTLLDAGVQVVQMPRIGAGQAGGNWGIIEGLIQERLVSTGIEVRVIDLPPGRTRG
ncbi:MAG: ImmA/IrrE family metallo-endopeptidase [Thiotrichales bacterium]|nr:ImmA/IrrE family metallo-endopeptidase [Thiotrichales bacterium]